MISYQCLDNAMSKSFFSTFKRELISAVVLMDPRPNPPPVWPASFYSEGFYDDLPAFRFRTSLVIRLEAIEC